MQRKAQWIKRLTHQPKTRGSEIGTEGMNNMLGRNLREKDSLWTKAAPTDHRDGADCFATPATQTLADECVFHVSAMFHLQPRSEEDSPRTNWARTCPRGDQR